MFDGPLFGSVFAKMLLEPEIVGLLIILAIDGKATLSSHEALVLGYQSKGALFLNVLFHGFDRLCRYADRDNAGGISPETIEPLPMTDPAPTLAPGTRTQ